MRIQWVYIRMLLEETYYLKSLILKENFMMDDEWKKLKSDYFNDIA